MMTTEQKNIECAKRDGWKPAPGTNPKSTDCLWERGGTCYTYLPNYHSSRDAIVPLIEKQFKDNWAFGNKFFDELWKIHSHPECEEIDLTDVYNTNAQITVALILSTPQQLQDALLRAWGIEI